jgi:hypothetical protein
MLDNLKQGCAILDPPVLLRIDWEIQTGGSGRTGKRTGILCSVGHRYRPMWLSEARVRPMFSECSLAKYICIILVLTS